MCRRNTEDGCILAAQQNELKERVTVLEHDVAKIRAETQEGFKQGAETMREINTSVANLAHDFGSRMNNIEARIITEKEKWGETLRKILVWSVKVLLAGAAVAMGVTIWNNIFK